MFEDLIEKAGFLGTVWLKLFHFHELWLTGWGCRDGAPSGCPCPACPLPPVTLTLTEGAKGVLLGDWVHWQDNNVPCLW